VNATQRPAAAQAGWVRRLTFSEKKRTFEAVAVLTSAPAARLDAAKFLADNRRYWSLEGGFLQRLDGAPAEDKSRVRQRNSADVLGLFRRLAVSLAAAWIARQPGKRQASTQDFFDPLAHDHHRAAFALVTARRPALSTP